jgi:hypothetical protein
MRSHSKQGGVIPETSPILPTVDTDPDPDAGGIQFQQDVDSWKPKPDELQSWELPRSGNERTRLECELPQARGLGGSPDSPLNTLATVSIALAPMPIHPRSIVASSSIWQPEGGEPQIELIAAHIQSYSG